MARRPIPQSSDKSKLKEKQKQLSDSVAAFQTVIQNKKEEKGELDNDIKEKVIKNESLDLLKEQKENDIKNLEEKSKTAKDEHDSAVLKVKELDLTKEEKEKKVKELEASYEIQKEDINSKVISSRKKYDEEKKALESGIDVLQNDKTVLESSVKTVSSTKEKLEKNLENTTQKSKELDVVINSKKVEIIKKDELLTNQSTASENAKQLISELNAEIAESKNDVLAQVEISNKLKEENEVQAEELEKNRKINLALIKKSKKIPALLSTIEEVYQDAGIKLSLT